MTRVIFYNCNMFIIPGTGVDVTKLFYSSPTLYQNKLECLPMASFIFASLMFVVKATKLPMEWVTVYLARF
jgi:hypothetical protein